MIARHAGSLLRLSALCLWLLRPSEAQAEAAAFAITLEYTAAPGCPDVAEFEAMLIARVGHDPFSERAQRHVDLRITSQGATLAGRTEWRDASGKWAGDQTFRMASRDCLRLTRTMALALAVQLQLLADTGRGAESGAVATPEPPPQASVVQAAPRTPPTEPLSNEVRAMPPVRYRSSRASSPTFALGTGASVGFGRSSTPILLGRVFGMLAWQHLSLQLGSELSMPASTRRADGAGFSQQLLLVSAAGCFMLSRWSGCLVVNAGEVRMVGEDIDRSSSARVPLVEAGLRVGFSQPFARRLFVRAHLDGLTLLTRRTGSLDSVPVWTAPPFAAAIGLDAGLRFP